MQLTHPVDCSGHSMAQVLHEILLTSLDSRRAEISFVRPADSRFLGLINDLTKSSFSRKDDRRRKPGRWMPRQDWERIIDCACLRLPLITD